MLKFPDSYINLSVSFHNLDINTNIKKRDNCLERRRVQDRGNRRERQLIVVLIGC
jgi:hypothetical protein